MKKCRRTDLRNIPKKLVHLLSSMLADEKKIQFLSCIEEMVHGLVHSTIIFMLIEI